MEIKIIKSYKNAVNAKEVITGAFVNATAVVRYIEQAKPAILSLVCTDAKYADSEDYLCALYIIKSCLEDECLDFDKIRLKIEKHPSSDGFLRQPMTKTSAQDFELAMQLDKFDFVIQAKRDRDALYLQKYGWL